MSSVVEYHRPGSLDEAIALVGRPGSTVLAGGTWVNAGERPRGERLIDLQALGLEGVAQGSGDEIVVGAMTRLSTLAADPAVPAWLRDLARREQPSTLRTAATVAGTLLRGGWESALVAGLLACDAVAVVAGPDGSTDVPATTILADPALVAGRIITAVKLSVDGVAAVHSTARTSADTPIVCCVARRTSAGARVAMSGVAPTAVVVDDVAALRPPGDFRGSSEYRSHLAAVLSARAIAEIGAQ